MAHTNCTNCRAPLPAPRSLLLRGLVLGLAYTVTFAFVFGFSLLGPVGFIILPFFLPGSIAAITSAHVFASDQDSCPACGQLIVREPGTIVIPRPAVARA